MKDSKTKKDTSIEKVIVFDENIVFIDGYVQLAARVIHSIIKDFRDAIAVLKKEISEEDEKGKEKKRKAIKKIEQVFFFIDSGACAFWCTPFKELTATFIRNKLEKEFKDVEIYYKKVA